ncbi:MAG: hypothetical protein ACFFD4_02320 [Candidatus Odinarchaeota archaeon]
MKARPFWILNTPSKSRWWMGKKSDTGRPRFGQPTVTPASIFVTPSNENDDVSANCGTIECKLKRVVRAVYSHEMPRDTFQTGSMDIFFRVIERYRPGSSKFEHPCIFQ